MNILLINSSQENVYGSRMIPAYPSLGLLYIAAVLERANHDVELIDYDVDVRQIANLRRIVRSGIYDLVGLSAVTPTINNAYYIAANIKALRKDIPIILGGIHATIAPNECMRHACIDFIVIGEGEHTIVEFVNELEKSKPDYSRIKGIAYKEEGQIYINVSRELEPRLDNFPFPARYMIKNPFSYSPPDAKKLPVTPIFLTRGCTGKCTYCCTKQIFGRRMRYRSIDNIMDEINEIVKLGYKEVHIVDDNVTANKKGIIDLCEEIRRRNYDLNYAVPNGMRADMVDYEVLSALKSIGVKFVGFGIESGNEKILESIAKGISKDTMREAVRLARKLKFEIWGFFMMGLPGDTPATMRETIDFAKELDPDFAKFLILKPYPGSGVYNQFLARNLIDNFNYSNYGTYTSPVHHLENLCADEIAHWQKKAIREFYFRPRKILKHILRIRNLTNLRFIKRGFLFVLKNMFRKH